MIPYVLRRLAALILITWCAVGTTFLLLSIAPGDPALAALGERARPEELQRFRQRFHLNEPLWRRFLDYNRNLARADLGRSYSSGQEVTLLLSRHFPVTLELACGGMAAALLISTPLGIIAARTRKRAAVMAVALYTASSSATPGFFTAYLLMVIFSTLFYIIPSGLESGQDIWLPALATGISLSGLLTRVITASVSNELKKPGVTLARSLGMGEMEIFFRHIWKSALIPVLTTAGAQFGTLLSGVVIAEVVFSWRGLGVLLIESVKARDLPVIQGVVLFSAGMYALVTLAADIAVFFLDPRSRHAPPAI